MEDFLEFLNYNEEYEEEHNIMRIPKRYIRDQQNQFEVFDNNQFKRRHRFSKHVVRDEILPLVTDMLELHSNRGLPIQPMIHLFTVLRFYATGNFQVVAGDLRGISQAFVSLIIKRVIRVRFENNEIEGLILDDNGYACKPYLLTPVLNSITRSEQNYNRANIRTRNIIERVFGVWKRRFPCLRRVAAIICATAVLYNIGRRANDNIDDEDDADQDWVENIIIKQDVPGN